MQPASRVIRSVFLLVVLLANLLGLKGEPSNALLAPAAEQQGGPAILVRLRPGAAISPALQTSQPGLQHALEQIGARSVREVYSANLSQPVYRLELPAGSDPAAAARILSGQPLVDFAEPDYLARLADAPDDPRYSEQWGLSQIGVESAWAAGHGSPAVVIAVIDSGLDLAHPDLAANLWVNPGETPGNGTDDDNNGLVDDVHGWNFVDGSNDVQDGVGHGSLVAGIAAARANNGAGIAGVCGLCRIMPVKVAQASGVANYSDIAAAIHYAVAKGARVINLSVGGYADSQAVREAVAAALAADIVVVGGAGNDNRGDPFYPAAYAGALAVAGTDPGDLRVSSSNYGAWVDLSAPGQDVLSTTLGEYASVSGTSYAAPFVSGLAGLLRSQNPDWTAAMVTAQLSHATTEIDSLNPELAGQLGSGRLDAGAAMQAPRPALTYGGYAVNGVANQRPDFNSTVDLTVSLRNDWADASGVSALLSSSDPYVTVTGAGAAYGEIRSGQSVSNAAPFVFQIAAGAGYNHVLPLTLRVTANDGAFVTEFDFSLITRSSEEEFSGTIDSDELLWTNDKIYKITGNVGIAPGSTLTIQAGTQVKFTGSYALNIGGTLLAQGTPDQPVRFEPYTAGGSWARISFADSAVDAAASAEGAYSDGNLLQHVIISGAAEGITCAGATPYLDHVATSGGGLNCALGATPGWVLDSGIAGPLTLSGGGDPAHLVRVTQDGGTANLPAAWVIGGSFTGAVTIQGDGTVTDAVVGSLSVAGTGDVQRVSAHGNVSISAGQVVDAEIQGGSLTGGAGCTLTGNTLRGGGISAGQDSTITYNSVENAPAAGIATSGASTVTYNRVVGGQSGISAAGGTVEHNLLANLTGGGMQAGAGASIRDNTFTGIQGTALTLSGVPAALDGNNFEFNTGQFDVVVTVAGGAALELAGQNNWWGTADGEQIKARIHDYGDDFELARLVYSPPLSGPAQEAPAYVRSVTLDPASPVGIEQVEFTVEYSRPMDTSVRPDIGFVPTEADTWKEVSLMPGALIGMDTVVLGGKIYVIGGSGDNRLDRYDPISKTWESLARMSFTRYRVGAAVVNGKIYAIGGSNMNTVEVYDPSTNIWTPRANMNTARTSFGLAVVNNKIYVMGGQMYQNSLEVYDPITDTWTVLANMPTGRDGLATAVVGNKIYALGGATGADFENWNRVEVYNPNTNTWTVLDRMPTQRYEFGATVFDEKIYTFGGPVSGKRVDVYDPSTKSWRSLNDMPTDIRNFGVVEYLGKAYLFGGYDNATGHNTNTVWEYTPAYYGEREIVDNLFWLDSTRYRGSYDFTVLNPIASYSVTAGTTAGSDGIMTALDNRNQFKVEYAGEISNTTPPAPPAVEAWGNGGLGQLSGRAALSGDPGAITGYRYAIGSAPGGTDVVNWTNTSSPEVTRTGLTLLAGQSYYISFKVRNAGGLWSPAGISNAVQDGVAIVSPQPVLNGLSTQTIVAGSGDTALTVSGSNFIPGSMVRWNSTNLATTYVNSGQLTAVIPADLLARTGSGSIRVYNPPPGGGESAGLVIQVLRSLTDFWLYLPTVRSR